MTAQDLYTELARLHAILASAGAGITKITIRDRDDTRAAISHVNAQLTDRARLDLISAQIAEGNVALALRIAGQMTTNEGRNACSELLRNAELPSLASPVERQRAFLAMAQAMDHEQRAAGQGHRIWFAPGSSGAGMVHIVAGSGTPCGWLRIELGMPMWVEPYQGTPERLITHELRAIRKLAREWTEHVITRLEGNARTCPATGACLNA